MCRCSRAESASRALDSRISDRPSVFEPPPEPGATAESDRELSRILDTRTTSAVVNQVYVFRRLRHTLRRTCAWVRVLAGRVRSNRREDRRAAAGVPGGAAPSDTG